jgi:hypothetical protein
VNPRRFSLRPFDSGAPAPGIRIDGAVRRRADALSIRFEIRGALPSIALPPPAARPGRRDRLWEDTCLELFLGPAGCRRYWEFNFSPSGHWNVYAFASYRDGMREEEAFAPALRVVRAAGDRITLSADVALGTIAPGGGALEAGVCAVILGADASTSHWALAHPGSRPDFHRRESFTMILPAG